MLPSKTQIVKWIEDIEASTQARCDHVTADVAQMQSDGAWHPKSSDHGRLFSALLTGESQRIVSKYIASSWASWIENRPFYLTLCTHPRVVVDLVPCSGDEFFDKYGCTPGQLAQLVLKMPESIRINIRNDQPESYAADPVIHAMSEVLALSKHAPCQDCFYRLAPIRTSAFGILGVRLSDLRTRATQLCQSYTEDVERRLNAAPAHSLSVVARDGKGQPLGQLVGRMTYYLVARDLWPGEAADPMVEEWISAESPLRFPAEAGQIAERLARIYTVHHLYTAPLTGALGGTYGWAPEELDFAVSRRTAGPGAHFNEPLSTWLFNLQAGMLQLPSVRSASYEKHLSRKPSDKEWANFLSVVDDNRSVIRAYWKMLEEVFLVAGAKVDPTIRPDVDLEDFQAVIDAIGPGRFESLFTSCVAAGAKIGASAGADVVGSATHVSPKIVTAGVALLGKAAERELEEFRAAVGKIAWRRAARTALTKSLSKLRTP